MSRKRWRQPTPAWGLAPALGIVAYSLCLPLFCVSSKLLAVGSWSARLLSSISNNSSTHGNSIGAGSFLVALCCTWEHYECENISNNFEYAWEHYECGTSFMALCRAWEQ